jgi:hypothetical protein
MKINKTMRRLVLTALVASGMAGASAQAQTPYLNTFDSSSSPFRFDFGGNVTADSVAWAAGPTYDAGGIGSSGSAQLNWTWSGPSGGAAFTADIIFPGQNYAGATLTFDIMVASSGVAGGSGDYGYFEVWGRNTDGYTQVADAVAGGLVGGVVPGAGAWYQVSVTCPNSWTAIRALTFQDYNDAGRNIVGSETIYIDNLSITPVPEPSSIALVGLGVAGFLFVRRHRTARS